MAKKKVSSGKSLSPVEGFVHGLELMRPKIEAALPKHVTVERLMRVVTMAVQKDPSLLAADRNSLYTATLLCSADGLVPDGREAALVVFKKQVQYIPMYQGVMKKVRNSGDLLEISAHCVHEEDVFDYELGDNAFIKHKPFKGGDRGKIWMTYAVAKTKDGGIFRELMDEDEIAMVKAVSKAGDKGPWGNWPKRMRKKSVILRICKMLPQSTDMSEFLLRQDDAVFTDNKEKPASVVVGANRLRQAMADQGAIEGEAEEVPPEDERPAEGGDVANAETTL